MGTEGDLVMRIRMLLMAAGAVALALGTPAQADEQVRLKRQVLSDCTAAKASFDALDPAGKEALTPYLSRVLDLHLTSSVGIQPQLPDASRALPFSSVESRPHELSIPADPADEIRAKQCALELLGKQGKDAFNALPAVLSLLGKPTTPQQLKLNAAARSRDIAAVFANDSTSFSAADRKTLSELPGYLTGGSAFAARAVLIELGGYGVPAIVERLPRATEEETSRITELLQSLQASGIASAPQLYPLLFTGDEAQQIRVIRMLVALEPALEEVLPPLIRLLDDLSAAVRLETRRAIKKLVNELSTESLALGQSDQDLLMKIFRMAPPAERHEMLAWLPALVNAVDGLELRLIDRFGSLTTELKRDIISGIGELKSPKTPSFAVVKSALSEQDAALRSLAIRALGRFSQSEAQVMKELGAALKALPPTRDSSERETIQRAVAEAVAILHPRTIPAPVLTALIKMLEMRLPVEGQDPGIHGKENASRFLEHSAVRALIAIGEPVRSPVEKIAKPGNSDQARRAIAVLGGLPPAPSSISILSTLLGSPHHGTRTEAVQALLAQGPSIIPQLRKQIATSSPAAAVAISEITIRLGEKTLADSRKIYRSLTSADCPTRAQAIVLIGDFSESERHELTPGLITCFGQNHVLDHETIKALARLAPLPVESLNRIVELLRSSDTSPQLRVALLDNARELEIPQAAVLSLFQELLSNQADTMQVRLIRSAGRYGQSSPELEHLIKGMITSDKGQRTRSDAAVSALARINRNAFNFSEWLADQLEEGDRERLERVLKHFPDDFAEQLLLDSLEKASDKERVIVLQLLSEIIKPAANIPAKISNLLQSGDLAVRFAAFRVSAACCPLPPEAIEALKDILFSNEVYLLGEIQINDNIRRALETIALQSTYLSERVSARRALGRVPPAIAAPQ